MKDELIGRKKEKDLLLKALDSDESEMIAVIGRRRVGKSFLIKKTYGERIVFELVGLQHANNAGQLRNFRTALGARSAAPSAMKKPADWLEAFFQLAQYLDETKPASKSVVFLDELPWLAGKKSNFLMGLGWFWNSWAVNRNIVVVVCGSAASWMIEKVVNDRGGLYNRITKRIYLQPFTLAETEAYLQARNTRFNRYQIAQMYMAMGGIPHHLKEIEAGKSAVQNINDVCFSQGGLLLDEFPRLYPSLFANAEHHLAAVRALAGSHQGLTRQDIVHKAKLPEGGNISTMLEELEQSGFIGSYFPFDKKKKDKLFRLTDEYSLFYLHFIENHRNQGSDTWQHLSQTPAWASWSGYAFENLCIKHLPQIKKKLSIAGVYAEASSYLQRAADGTPGLQIDLVLDRRDQVINLFEMKFYAAAWNMTKAEALGLLEKVEWFKRHTKTAKQVFITLVTAMGATQNEHSLMAVDSEVWLDDLFETA
jgi:uncharacterized protein